jgi:hypothetical protein
MKAQEIRALIEQAEPGDPLHRIIKIDSRQFFLHVLDEEGNLRLGHHYKGINRENFINLVKRTAEDGTIIRHADKSLWERCSRCGWNSPKSRMTKVGDRYICNNCIPKED